MTWLSAIRARKGTALAVVAAMAVVCGGAAWHFTLGRSAGVNAAQLAGALPSSATTVAYVDLGALRRAGVLARLAGSRVSADAEYDAFVAESGFDYQRDLDAVALAWSGDTRYIAAAGRFRWSALERYAAKRGGSADASYCRMPSSLPGQTISWYPARSRWIGEGGVLALAVGPSGEAARRVGFGGAGGAGTGIPSQPVWIATSGMALRGAQASLPAGTGQFSRLLETAERVVLAIGPSGNDFELTMEALCATPQEAAVMVVQLDALTGLIRKIISSEKRQANPGDLSGMLTEGSFRKEDRKVSGRWPVRRELVEALAQ